MGYNFNYVIENYTSDFVGLLNDGQQHVLWYWVRMEDDIPGNKSPMCLRAVNIRHIYETNILNLDYSEILARCTDPDGDSVNIVKIVLDETSDNALCQLTNIETQRKFELVNNPPADGTNCNIRVYVRDQYGNESNYLEQIRFYPYVVNPL